MAPLRTDSPLSRSIVSSFLQFLSSVEAAPGVDAEGLEVAAQCLSEVFGLTNQQSSSNIRLLSLVDLFNSVGLGPTTWTPSAPPASDSLHFGAASSVGRSAGEQLIADESSGESLLEQFKDGLELAGFFDGTMNDTPEYSDKVKQAKAVLDEARKKIKSSTTTPTWSAAYSEDTLVLAEAFKIQGNTTMSNNEYHNAIQLYTLALSLCSNNAIFHSNRAAALTQVGKYEEAVADCEAAIKLDPRYSKAYSRLGRVYYAQGRLHDAIEKGFKKALELDPSSTSVKENLRAVQQKLEEQQRNSNHQDPPQPQPQPQPQENQNFGAGFNTGTSMNVPLPAEIANLIPGLINLAAQLGRGQNPQQGAGPGPGAGTGTGNGNRTGTGTGTGQNQSPSQSATDNTNQTAGGWSNNGAHRGEPEVNSDSNFNITLNGQELPPQFTGLMQSALHQLFGGTQGQNGWPSGGTPNPNPNTNTDTNSNSNSSPQQGAPGGP